MAYSASDYLQQLQGLMPQGPAWPTEDGSATAITLDGLSQELARIDARIERLIEEADPRVTFELLPDWERVVGWLPCQSGPAATLAERRAQLVAKLTGLGGQTPAFYIALAASIGYTITITEFRPWDVSMAVDLPIYGDDWAYAWQVNAPSVTVRSFIVSSGVDEALRSWGNAILECVLRLTKPAHTIIIFAYS